MDITIVGSIVFIAIILMGLVMLLVSMPYVANNTDWDVYVVCSCGHKAIAPFGKMFHVHFEVCPKCGKDKYKMKLITGRYVKGKFETRED